MLALYRYLRVVTQFELSASLECAGLAPLCYRAERGTLYVGDCALRARTKRRQVGALQGGVQFQTAQYLSSPRIDTYLHE